MTTAESKPSVADEEMKDEQKGEDIEIDLPTTPITQEKEEKTEVTPVAPVSQPPTKSYQSHKHLFDLIDAIKTLQKPNLINPLIKHAFDDHVVEIMQKNRNISKKTSITNTKIEESDSKLPFITTKENNPTRSSLKSQLSMKSSTRKARDE